jgi:hypothetical protein
MTPGTLEEWGEYIASLEDARLEIESEAANSLDFGDVMEEEGYSPTEILEILKLFALEMHRRGFALPDRGAGMVTSYYTLVHGFPDGR